MNLDRHLISIRARTFPGLCDLALQVVRSFLPTLLLALAVTAVPLAVVNYLICEMPVWSSNYSYGNPARGWMQLGLVYIESQIGTVVITAWLGRAMFYDQPTLRASIYDVLHASFRVIWVHTFLRPVGFMFLLLWANSGSNSQNELEMVIVFGLLLLLIIGAIRTFRPFASEIVILEKTPILMMGKEKKKVAVGYSKRSQNLHGFASSVVLSRTILLGMVAGLMTAGIYGMIMFSDGVLAIDLGGMGWARQLFWAIALWLVAGFSAVVRFLSYIDLRARQEGWDAELKVKAEAYRMVV